jgi:hypothetical protein
MAEYKALAQNTYKFISENTLFHAGDIGHSLAPQIGRAKVLTSKGEVLYTNVAHYGRDSYATDTKCSEQNRADLSTSSAIAPIGNYLGCTALNVSCVVDGIRYYGLKNAKYALSFLWQTNTVRGGSITISGGNIFPAFTVKIVKYVAAGGTISVIEKKLNTVTTTEVFKQGTSGTNGSYAAGYQSVLLDVEKTADDIILAISIEYEAHDLSISGTAALQYSVDDGLTFHDVENEITLESIEHIIFKNVSDSATCYIGTGTGLSNVASVSIGQTIALPITADVNWYIS